VLERGADFLHMVQRMPLPSHHTAIIYLFMVMIIQKYVIFLLTKQTLQLSIPWFGLGLEFKVKVSLQCFDAVG